MVDRSSARRISEDWVQMAEARLGFGFWSWDFATSTLTCSPGLYALVGINSASMHIDLPFLESLVHPQDRLPFDDSGAFAADSRQADRQFRLIRPDGQLRYLQSEARGFHDRDGTATKVVAVVSDVTTSRDAKRRLATKRGLLAKIAEMLDGTLWVVDRDGKVVEGYSGEFRAQDDLADSLSNWRSKIHPDDMFGLRENWRETFDQRKPYHFSPRIQRADGEFQHFYASGLPFTPDHAGETYYAGITTPHRSVAAPRAVDEQVDCALTPAQVRACRALLDWTAENLAQNAGVSLSTIRRIESAETAYGQSDSLRLVAHAFRQAGLSIWRGEDGRFCVSDLA